MLDDVTVGALQAALNGLAARPRAISDDIANVNTPYFKARTVAFENDLKRAVETGRDPMTVRPEVQVSQAPGGLTGNNVNLTDETVAAVKTQLSYELALRATGDRFSVLRSAVRAV